MPEIIWATDGFHVQHPIFVSAKKALTASGELDPALFSRGDIAMIERDVLDADYKECHGGFRVSSHEDPRLAWKDLDGIVAGSDVITVARVTGAEEGFRLFFPGTLFRIEPESWLKSRADWKEKFIFFPSGKMKLRGENLCFRDVRFSELPQLGWKVLIFYKNTFNNRKNSVLLVKPEQIVVISPDDEVFLPQFLQDRQAHLEERGGKGLIAEVATLVEEDLR